MDKKKVWELIRSHKKELAIATGVAIVGGIVYLVTKQKTDSSAQLAELVNGTIIKDLEVPNCINIGTVDQCWLEDNVMNMIVNDLTVKDLGKFGEELIKLDDITPDTGVSTIIGLSNEW